MSDRLSIDGYRPRRLGGLDLANSRRFLPQLRRVIASHVITDLGYDHVNVPTAPGAGHEEPVFPWSRF